MGVRFSPPLPLMIIDFFLFYKVKSFFYDLILEILVKVNHVMEKEHFIEWIALADDRDIYKVKLFPEQNAECKFKYIRGSKLYAYCNKHGLWSCDVE